LKQRKAGMLSVRALHQGRCVSSLTAAELIGSLDLQARME